MGAPGCACPLTGACCAARYFTWDATLFPEPAALQEDIASRGRRTVTIIDPHIKRDPSYHIYSEAAGLDFFVKDRDGKEFDGCAPPSDLPRPRAAWRPACPAPVRPQPWRAHTHSGVRHSSGAGRRPGSGCRWCWPGSSSYLDMLNPAARDWWAKQFQLDAYKGSTRHLYVWNDMNEPSVFNGPEVRVLAAVTPSGRPCVACWAHRALHIAGGELRALDTCS